MLDFSKYRKVAKKLAVDAVALVPGPNFTQALGHEFFSNERPLVVIVPADGAPAAIVPNIELASWALVGFEGAVFDWFDQSGYDNAFARLTVDLPLTSLAVEGQVMRVFVMNAFMQAMPGLRIIDAEREISELRIIKTDADIAALQAAIDISERALARVIENIRIGQTEKEIARALVQALFAEGAEDLAFAPIVAAGDNSARLHAHAREDYAIRSGDALLIDFGARKHGFAADITRTFFVGEVSDEGRAVYQTVLAANQMGFDICRPGVSAHDIDDAVTGVLEASPYADRIRVKTGHGLGREVHEAPYIMRGNDQTLRSGMVWTNEPGLYEVGKFGVRIEDDVLVTEGGCRSLTTFPKDIRIIGR